MLNAKRASGTRNMGADASKILVFLDMLVLINGFFIVFKVLWWKMLLYTVRFRYWKCIQSRYFELLHGFMPVPASCLSPVHQQPNVEQYGGNEQEEIGCFAVGQ